MSDRNAVPARNPAATRASIISVPLAEFKAAKSVMLPQGYPGEWNYWLAAPEGRGGRGDTMRLGEVERLQFSLRTAGAAIPRVEIEWVGLGLD